MSATITDDMARTPLAAFDRATEWNESEYECSPALYVRNLNAMKAALEAFSDYDRLAEELDDANGQLSDIDDELDDETDDTQVVAVRRLVRDKNDAVRERKNAEWDRDRLAEEVGRLKAALESVRDHLVVFKSYGDGVVQAVAYRIADQALTKGDCDE